MASELYPRYKKVSELSGIGIYRFARDLSQTPPKYDHPMPDGIAPPHVILGRRPIIGLPLVKEIKHKFPDLQAVYSSLDPRDPDYLAEWFGQSAILHYLDDLAVRWFQDGHYPPQDGETLRIRDINNSGDGSLELGLIGSSDHGKSRRGLYWRGNLIVRGTHQSEFISNCLESINDILKSSDPPIWKLICSS